MESEVREEEFLTELYSGIGLFIIIISFIPILGISGSIVGLYIVFYHTDKIILSEDKNRYKNIIITTSLIGILINILSSIYFVYFF